jgi:hypothetical protein
MSPAEVEQWILKSSFDTLEAKLFSFDTEDRKYLLTWAKDLERRQMGNEAQIKWAVAIIGALAPHDFLEDDPLNAKEICVDVLDAEEIE